MANIPGAVKTSTFALTNATLSYALQIANKGSERAIKENKSLLRGLNVYQGNLTHKAVADFLNLEYTDPENLI